MKNTDFWPSFSGTDSMGRGDRASQEVLVKDPTGHDDHSNLGATSTDQGDASHTPRYELQVGWRPVVENLVFQPMFVTAMSQKLLHLSALYIQLLTEVS